MSSGTDEKTTITATNTKTNRDHNQTHQQVCRTLMMGITRAFEKVWYPGLIYKITLFGIGKVITKLINDLITERTYQEEIGKEPISAGIPQDAELYNIYSADILKTAQV